VSPAGQPVAGRARPAARINPATVRGRRFPPRRSGVDPAEVRAFLHAVADELAALQRELVILHQENQRLKRALRDRQALRSTPPRSPRPAGPRWPVNPG